MPNSSWDNDPRSLSKFSYLIYAKMAPSLAVHGTACFIKYNKDTFLVTAAHVITGWNPVTSSLEYITPNIFSVMIYNSDTKLSDTLLLDITYFKENSIKSFYYASPDIFLTKVSLLPKYEINIITIHTEDYNEGYLHSNIYCYGYHVRSDMLPSELIMEVPSSALGNIITGLDQLVSYPGTQTIDSINYLASMQAGGYGQGYSGCPIFIKKNGNDGFIFGGIGLAGDSSFTNMAILKPQEIIKAVNRFNEK